MTENELVSKFIEQSSSDCVREVAIFSRCCDLIIDSTILKAVSFKLHDWKTVIEQSKTYELAVDKQYICMPIPARGFNEQFIDTIKWFGIGLIVYKDDKFQLKIKAKRNETFLPSYNHLRYRIEETKKERRPQYESSRKES